MPLHAEHSSTHAAACPYMPPPQPKATTIIYKQAFTRHTPHSYF